ncbi:MAG: ATP-dependent RNA helicase RhlB, partial [Gammaproteobacteria bacterium]|nr:ATP-dependent RNA helicase RhlB [Gammaproteobacteria bacterium]
MSEKVLTDVCFENFALHPQLLKGLEEAGFVRCTPIQAMTLPLTLEGKDVAGQAQTGTGKTAAFLVALYNRLLNRDALPQRRAEDPRAVILAPTRELAVQIEKDAHQIGAHTGLRLALIYGGVDYDKQRAALEAGVDLVIATPGRLIDFLKQGTVSFQAIEMMVLDEADRMFELGFIKDIRYIIRRMPGASERQNLLFSATLSHRVLELAYEHMNDPEKLVVESDSITAANVRQAVYFPAREEKLPLLLGLLAKTETDRSMVFVNTKAACERVALTLERAGYKVGVLSGDVPQKKRESLLGRFVRGELNFLVATDVAARGLHIPAVSHVYNFDLPFDAEDYVHRIGRTARLGAEGDAISFACDEYAMSLPDIEAYIEQKIPVESINPELLAPLPPRRPRGEGGESVVEDAMADAAETRRKRRERDRRDGDRGGRSHSGSRGAPRGDGRREGGERGRRRSEGPREERPREPREAEAPAEAPAMPAAASPPRADGDGPAGEAPRKRRRRGRGRRRPQGEDAASA